MSVLNFSKDNLITGINIIDGNLYWTDGVDEPKKIEISKFNGEDTSFNVNSTEVVTTVDNRLFNYADVTVIRPHPFRAIKLELTEFVATELVPEPPFEQIFPRFSYRWRYEDGQYSPYAPFTEAAWMSETRDADTDNNNYTEGFNTTLYNNVGTINLTEISRGTPDVVAVELVYTESISATIYVLETLEIPKLQRGIEFELNNSYTFGVPNPGNYLIAPLNYQVTARKIYSALPPNQLLRPFDDVPRSAFAQEITANRLVFANYLRNYDQPQSVSMTVTTIDSNSFPYLYPSVYPQYAGTTPDAAVLANLTAASKTDGLNLKSNRSYEIGVVYIDAFGRQGGMIQAGSVIAEDGTVSETNAVTVPFYQNARKRLVVQLNDPPPDFADTYRYYIKDTSTDFHSLISYNIYNDGLRTETDSEYVWVEFLSTDRNKIQDDTIISPRRVDGSISLTRDRHLIQDIEGELPDVIRNQINDGPNVEFIPLSAPSIASQYEYTSAPSFPQTDLSPQMNPVGGQPFLYIQESTAAGIAQYSWFNAINAFLSSINITERLIEIDQTVPDDQAATYQSIAIPPDSESSLFLQFSAGTPADVYLRVKSVSFSPINNNPTRDVLTIEFYEDLPVGLSSGTTFQWFTTVLNEEAQKRLNGRFWCRIARTNLVTAESTFNEDGTIDQLSQVWFETEPRRDSDLDLFWESNESFCVCTDHGWPNKLNWSNSVAEYDGTVTNPGIYLESQRIFNQFNQVQLMNGVRVNTPQARYAEERRATGLTWSGIYNSRTGINRLNSFIAAEGITKEIEPNYGSIQKLYTRDTNLIVFAEDKCFRILADKDALFNADGGGNVSASNAVLGQTTPFIPEFGISKNPESFASYGHNIWFSDKNRGAILQLTPSNGQMLEMQNSGMNDFVKDALMNTNGNIIGSYDNYHDTFNITLKAGTVNNYPSVSDTHIATADDGYFTLSYQEDVQGWSSFKSFNQEAGVTLNNVYYTWFEGRMWRHNDDTVSRNSFYDSTFPSSIQFIFNDSPSAVKEFKTVNYEGTNDWQVNMAATGTNYEDSTDTEVAVPPEFVNKEGKKFAFLIQNAPNSEFVNGIITTVGTRVVAGIKGFYAPVTFTTENTDKQELFAVGSEVFISSN